MGEAAVRKKAGLSPERYRSGCSESEQQKSSPTPRLATCSGMLQCTFPPGTPKKPVGISPTGPQADVAGRLLLCKAQARQS